MKTITFLWKWWDNRNKANAGELIQSCQEVTRAVITMTDEGQKSTETHLRAVSTCPQRWSPLEQGWLKINVDDAFLLSQSRGAWGFIIRDSSGELVMAGAGNAGLMQDVLMAETTACLRASEIAEQYGISHIQALFSSFCFCLLR